MSDEKPPPTPKQTTKDVPQQNRHQNKSQEASTYVGWYSDTDSCLDETVIPGTAHLLARTPSAEIYSLHTRALYPLAPEARGCY
jgi:hypothetical protein